ncbi:unnamed protein product [Oppiella nova]|uniref:Protein kinase domain-containing protein n=1 Tax=Oppiella nova TaxID=334625 RepID=A0A7R9LTF3_9ACAR|nr:unnamed protein product [Oppiella nova]CAG2166780.1 unnamed protein product [Oppiella nova]
MVVAARAYHKGELELNSVKLELIGKGGFDYTIKELNRLSIEVETLKAVKSGYVVQYYDSWTENINYCIQMEYYESKDLQNILEMKKLVFDRQSGEAMDCVDVQYLHELNPQIIHRDLKPENILIAKYVRNGRFVKLCDFGLATVHNKRIHNRTTQKHTSDVGDIRYMAPEVTQGQKYNHKSDIYSLALIAGKIFDFDSETIFIKIWTAKLTRTQT